jgi:hypothetical protein
VAFTKTLTQELHKPALDILALLQTIEDRLSQTTLRQMSRVILAMLVMTGRVTMLRTIQRAAAGRHSPGRDDAAPLLVVILIFPK